MSAGVLLRDVELLCGTRTDVRVRAGRVAAVGSLFPTAGEEVIAAGGAALSVGLADHHLHLLAMAASAQSLDLHPAAAPDAAAVTTALRSATADATGWIRAVGYAGQAGPLDARSLDAARRDIPVRVQHRSGALWMLNTTALEAVGIPAPHEGLLWRGDGWLAQRLPPAPQPDLRRLGSQLAAYGITAVTDATVDLPERSRDLLLAAVADGRLPQRLMLLGAGPGGAFPPRVCAGPMKILLSDHELPPFADLCDRVREARRTRRAVAVHCVTREALALTIAAFDEMGPKPGDRIEHGALIGAADSAQLRRLGVTVVTQPGFLAERGDDYLRDLPDGDIADLYRFASLEAAGVPVACSSDAPYGPVDPWAVLQAAADRRAPNGAIVGGGERVPVRQALRSYLADQRNPGGSAREVRAGVTADLVMLHVPWNEALAQPSADLVRCTFIDGQLAGPST